MRSRMKLVLLICVVALSCSTPYETAHGESSGSGFGQSLFADFRARNVGDILTIIVIESSTASHEATTSVEKETDISANADISAERGSSTTGGFIPLFNPFKLDLGISGNNDFEGNATTSRSNEVEATLAARVMAIEENGNLIIQGSKLLEVNSEKQVMVFSGVVRPKDISTDNTVLSTSVAELQVAIKGTGVVNSGQRPGPLSRLFSWFF